MFNLGSDVRLRQKAHDAVISSIDGLPIMNQIQAMRVFVRIVDMGSFTLAARQMDLSAPAVTRAVSALESHLNMRLLNRSTRGLSLTDAGRHYFDGCRAILSKLGEVESDLMCATRDISGVIRVASTASFSVTGLGPLLAAYRRLNRKVQFDLTIFDTHVDMIVGGFDVCFTTDRDTLAASLVSRRLVSIKDIAVATPGYLAVHGEPFDSHALLNHDLLTVSEGLHTWGLLDNGSTNRVSGKSVLKSTNCMMVREAALADMGIAFLPESLVVDDIAKGALREVLKKCEVVGGPREISIVYSGRNYLTMRVRSFVDFATTYYRSRADTPASLRIVA
jgi:DNA-binding transcriptional LysR family regulator